MKKTFLTRRNALIRSRDLSWGAFALLFALVLLAFRLLLPNLFFYIFSPITNLSQAASSEVRNSTSGFTNAMKLARENESLTEANADLLLKNRTLTDELQTISPIVAEEPGIPAGVVARPPASPYDTLLLGAGSAAGVKIGMTVFATGDTPIGVITLVTSNYARATLLSAPGETTLGWVGKANDAISIQGGGAGVLYATVPRSLQIAEGDVVSVPGPGPRAVGTVSSVRSDPSSPSMQVSIKPVINLFSVSWVVIREGGESLKSAVPAATSTHL